TRALGPHVTVSRSAEPGVELALGIVRDPQFGPLVMAGAGGVLVELLADRVFALPPLDAGRAGTMLRNLTAGRLLGGFRTVPACDATAVASAIVRLSALAADVGDLVRELDINPLIAGPSGCVAVDVLVRLDLPARRAAPWIRGPRVMLRLCQARRPKCPRPRLPRTIPRMPGRPRLAAARSASRRWTALSRC
ncbi:MAG: acetate--CoA ligase family protein, partial [Actinobacteria bacterium]|nr:acetate--CoA ligase family protein [Actinomycetota bacterium]